jgi:hypothetical protein
MRALASARLLALMESQNRRTASEVESHNRRATTEQELTVQARERSILQQQQALMDVCMGTSDVPFVEPAQALEEGLPRPSSPLTLAPPQGLDDYRQLEDSTDAPPLPLEDSTGEVYSPLAKSTNSDFPLALQDSTNLDYPLVVQLTTETLVPSVTAHVFPGGRNYRVSGRRYPISPERM